MEDTGRESQTSGERKTEQEPPSLNVSDPQSIIDALRSDQVTKIYANGFTNTHSNADVSLIFQQYGKPVGVVQMSFTLAKTLAQKLDQMIDNVEKTTGKTVSVTDDFEDSSS